jgi:scyllo-inositol 2-dehydrogenase (NADP+)
MVRFGIVGTNWITEEFIKAASLSADFVLAAVYSRTKEKAKEFAAKFSVKHIFTDLESMAKSGEIDAVYLASPNSFHASQAIVFLNNKIHVLCEKPMASHSGEVKEMAAAAKRNNVLLMEALKTTQLPNFMSIKSNLQKLGKIRRYTASYCKYSSRYDAYKEGTVLNAFKPEYSNGSLMDLGVYCLYPMAALFGKPLSVKASGFKLETGVDGEGSLIMDYGDMDAIVMFSKIANSYLPSEIQGENGSMLIDKIHTPEEVMIRYREGSTENITSQQDKPSMYYEANEFIELINNRKIESAVNSLEVSLIVAEIMEEARRQIGIIYPADK